MRTAISLDYGDVIYDAVKKKYCVVTKINIENAEITYSDGFTDVISRYLYPDSDKHFSVPKDKIDLNSIINKDEKKFGVIFLNIDQEYGENVSIEKTVLSAISKEDAEKRIKDTYGASEIFAYEIDDERPISNKYIITVSDRNGKKLKETTLFLKKFNLNETDKLAEMMFDSNVLNYALSSLYVSRYDDEEILFEWIFQL